ncbi:MAG: cadherin domain-containing protein, partial [Gammaproteobacteria bacterium]|nr:cadherin domain-containing protein [Gammaproteobacteria bacterium]MDH5593958.1 cadherin domain-containing protein [Gammaproteobacteria bacterium]
DVDTGAVEGVAVISVDNTNGTWQYNNGGGWTAFGAVSNTSAVLLDANDLIRFVPNANYNGTAGNIEFRAWDTTTGLSGDTAVDVSANGGTTAFSAATETATLTVNAVNDAPTGTVSITGTTTEGDTLTASNTLADVDGLGSITYQWQRGGADILGATSSTYTLVNADVGFTITVVASYTDGDGTLESVTSNPTAAIADFNNPPVVNDQSFNLDEESANATVVGTVTATDADADTLTYSITAGDPGGVFAIDGNGQITVANSASLTAGGTSYSLTVQVQDDGTGLKTDTAIITINVDTVAVPIPEPEPAPPPPMEVPVEVVVEEIIVIQDEARDTGDVTSGEGERRADSSNYILSPEASAGDAAAEAESAQDKMLGALPMEAAELEGLVTEADAILSEEGSSKFTFSKSQSNEYIIKSKLRDEAAREEHFLSNERAIWDALNEMRNQLDGTESEEGKENQTKLKVAVTQGVTWSLSAGIIAWAFRAGSLLATLLSTLPLWRWFDPLPILAISEKERSERKEEMLKEEMEETNKDKKLGNLLDKTMPAKDMRKSRGDNRIG